MARQYLEDINEGFKISPYLIIVIVIILFLLSGGRLQRHRREKIRTELGGMLRTFEKDVGSIGQGIFHASSSKLLQKTKKIQKTKYADEKELIDEAVRKTEEKNKERKNTWELIKEASRKNVREISEQKPEKELIEEAVEKTERKNKQRKTVEELI